MQHEEVVFLDVNDIIPNRFQPREVFEDRPLKELAVSIREHGVIQPIIVRQTNDKYEIIAGERRYKASCLAGLTKIPAIIRNLDDKETSKVALLENLQRKNLNPLEEARTYKKILEVDDMTQEELARTMGKSQSAVSNKMRLLSLPDEVQDALMKDNISERHARALLNVEDAEKQKKLLNEIITNKMSVRQLEGMINDMNGNIENNNINEDTNLMESEGTIQSRSNYVSDSPLMPNFSGVVTTENGEEPLLIVPPEKNIVDDREDETVDNSKFINFGEITNDNEDEDEFLDEDDDMDEGYSANKISAGANIDINAMQENTQDISSIREANSSGVDLDTLLKVNTSDDDSSVGGGFKFFSPAEEAIRESENNELPKNSGDYFKTPDLINVDLPNESTSFNTNTVSLSDSFNVNLEEEKEPTIINSTPAEPVVNDNNNINKAVSMIRDTLNQIEAGGIKVEKDEISLENSYQIVIKLNK